MGETLRILLLEDVPSDAELVKIELRQAGIQFTALRVETETEFHRALADFQPDLILADYSLPSFNALEALCIVNQESPGTPFILVTGSQSEEIAARVMKEGAEDYLLKSSLMRLPSAMRNALERKVAHKAKLQAEEALRESEEKYHSVFNNFIDLYYQTDIQGLITNLSPSCFILSGWKPEELIGHQILEFYPDPEQRKALLEKLHREGAVSDYGITLLHRDGRRLTVSVSSHLIRDEQGNPKYVEGTIRDITERRRAEEALRREQMMLARTEGIAQIGSWEWDITTDTVTWSDELFRIFQRDPREGAPSFAEHPAFYHPDDTACMQQAVEVAVALGTPYELELRAIRKDGETRVCMARGVAEMAPGGRAVHLFGSLQDITERKLLEQTMEKARADFLFAVSHELKTPLHVMGAIQEMIESLPEERRLAHFRDYSDFWRRNMMRLRFIIENLVDSQRPAGMGVKLEKRPANLMDLAREIARELGPVASARSVQIRFQEGSVPTLSLDGVAIQRLLENLLTNAIKFSPLGGQVEIRWRIEGEMVCLDIVDFGMGIDPKLKPFLFLPFYRTPEAIKAGVQGTGLGLYVAKMIAEAHGGTIQLESEPDKGTTVTVLLPLDVPEDKKQKGK